METHFFTKEVISGFYNIENPHWTCVDNEAITLQRYLGVTHSGSGFTVTHNESGVDVGYTGTLAPEELSALTASVSIYKAYQPSTIESINYQWSGVYSDYKQARLVMIGQVWGRGWESLNDCEKKIATKWFTVPAEYRDQIFNRDMQTMYGREFHINSTTSRRQRAMFIMVDVYNRFTWPEIEEIMGECDTLVTDYIEYGLEGTEAGDSPGLYDYVLGVSGTPWYNSGLAQKEFVPSGIAMTGLVNKMMATLRSGIY